MPAFHPSGRERRGPRLVGTPLVVGTVLADLDFAVPVVGMTVRREVKSRSGRQPPEAPGEPLRSLGAGSFTRTG
ncbi:hypothetical protein FHR84_002709 [Actinopolyspora biskrensis]|uniref:Uncharacterized protein n=1 Tax=Actinopolyspora biskrensis TaxID=1470178 RepID=A0A852Z274_9ACTN|nr:hypothetical protein [Actinopolyspora biskrensis]